LAASAVNTVLTSLYGLNARAIEPFFLSLRQSGFEGSAVVFVTAISDDCRAVLARYGATVIDSEYHGLPMAYAGFSRRALMALQAIYRYSRRPNRPASDFRYLFVNCWRFFCFQQYLRQLAEPPEFVLLADVRDVVFQRDPFRFGFERGLSVAFESGRRTIGQSNGNRKWLWESVGWREMRRIAHHTPVCAGTTLADYETMLKYLDAMTHHINLKFVWGLFDSIDQGLHNYLVHNQLVTPVHGYRNWNGPFLTLDSEVVLPENKNAEGYLCNRDGSVVPIVHQYDRIPALHRPGEPVPPCWEIHG
jgi:hypothetical protein